MFGENLGFSRKTRLTSEQINVLNNSFEKNNYASFDEISRIVSITNLQRKQVTTWFHSRRHGKNKYKVKEKKVKPNKRETYKHKNIDQRIILEKEFLKNSYLSESVLKLLMITTGLNKLQILQWFEKRRVKPKIIPIETNTLEKTYLQLEAMGFKILKKFFTVKVENGKTSNLS